MKELLLVCNKGVTDSVLQNIKQTNYLSNVGLEPRIVNDEKLYLANPNKKNKVSLLHQNLYNLKGLSKPCGVYEQLDIPLCSEFTQDILDYRRHNQLQHKRSRPLSARPLSVRSMPLRPVIKSMTNTRKRLLLYRRRVLRNCLTYCFTAKERRERFRVLCTGLNYHGRQLKKLCRPCFVNLEPLSTDLAEEALGHSKWKVYLTRLSPEYIMRKISQKFNKHVIKKSKNGFIPLPPKQTIDVKPKMIRISINMEDSCPAIITKSIPKPQRRMRNRTLKHSKAGLPLSGQKVACVIISPRTQARADIDMAVVRLSPLSSPVKTTHKSSLQMADKPSTIEFTTRSHKKLTDTFNNCPDIHCLDRSTCLLDDEEIDSPLFFMPTDSTLPPLPVDLSHIMTPQYTCLSSSSSPSSVNSSKCDQSIGIDVDSDNEVSVNPNLFSSVERSNLSMSMQELSLDDSAIVNDSDVYVKTSLVSPYPWEVDSVLPYYSSTFSSPRKLCCSRLPRKSGSSGLKMIKFVYLNLSRQPLNELSVCPTSQKELNTRRQRSASMTEVSCFESLSPANLQSSVGRDSHSDSVLSVNSCIRRSTRSSVSHFNGFSQG